MKRLWEIGKDVLIALLAAAILVLTVLALPSRFVQQTPWLATILKPFASVLGMQEADLTYQQAAVSVPDAAQPLAITVKNAAGRCSYQYDFTSLDAAYQSLGSALGQALDTAETPEESTLAKLYTAMTGEGVLFEYPAAIPAGVLASWLDAQMDGDTPQASVYFLSIQEGSVRLYLAGDACYVCQTSLSADTLMQLLDTFRPDGSFFAMEDTSGRYDRLDRCSLLPAGTVSVPETAAANPVTSPLVTALASRLGFNPYGDASYTDAAGSTWFTETSSSLRVASNGAVTLRNSLQTDRRFALASDAPGEIIEAARALLTEITADCPGDSRLYLSSFTQTDGVTVCTFDYVVSGVPVVQKDGPAASFTFSDSALTEAEVLLRAYTPAAAQLTLMPAAQAAVIVPEGTKLAACYADEGQDSLTAGWKS